MKSERNNLFNSSQSWRHLLCFVLSNRKSPPEGTVNQLWPKNWQNWQYLHYWRTPQDSKGTKMSGRNLTIQCFRFLAQLRGFRAARGQNIKIIGFFGDLWLFLGGFWPVAALKPNDCTRNLKNRIVWFLPDILVPLLSRGLCQ